MLTYVSDAVLIMLCVVTFLIFLMAAFYLLAYMLSKCLSLYAIITGNDKLEKRISEVMDKL